MESFLADMLVRFRNRVMNVPVRAAIRIVGETDINVITRVLEKEMESTLEELAGYNPDEIDGLSGIEDGYDEEDEEDMD